MPYFAKYGTAFTVRMPILKASSSNQAATGDWTPAAGDVKIYKDGSAANVTNLPTVTTSGNASAWVFSLTATEMQAKEVLVLIADSATKAVQDNGFTVLTYGNASAQLAIDLSDTTFGLSVQTFNQPGQATPPTTGLTVNSVLGYLMKIAFNKITNDGTTTKLYNADDATVDQKFTTSSSGGTVTRTRGATGP
jgi:hypothetical protein